MDIGDILSEEESDIDDIPPDDDDDETLDSPEEFVPTNQPHQTSPYMTKFEKAAIIGKRSEQLDNNAPMLIELSDEQHLNSFEIAQIELDKKLLNFTIRRYLSFEHYEDFDVCDLIIKE